MKPTFKAFVKMLRKKEKRVNAWEARKALNTRGLMGTRLGASTFKVQFNLQSTAGEISPS
jgi:hypothetical protein